MRNVEMRHLRYFVAVAEAGSVMAGARSVGIVQPALSRQIRELEEAIGTPLLARKSKGVELTAAGASFFQDAKQLLADLTTSRERALRCAAGQLGELRLGVLPSYLGLPVVTCALKAFRASCPDVKVSVSPMLSAEQVAAIANKQLDGGIMAWRRDEAPYLSSAVLISDRFVLAIPASQGRRRKGPGKLAELADQPFVWFDPRRSATHHRFLIAQCERAGFTPQVTQIGSDVPTLIGLVAAGMGCAFVPESLSAVCPPTVRLIPLEEVAERFDVEFAFDGDTAAPVVSRFLDALRQVTARRMPKP
ncbi:LysR family transcriptional regulator [Paraburkholderia sp. UYCP14C]|uniref:LysR family transcriptional regulator n=1 Tax=Paraburkholderia sp. UYCP14C TaxID=2511130 RepID=UPI0010210879|nr:LysR family transcriptional regulator [Paraburkholderia sp. UYCP14C]RZF28509.1 LysR family transcriptional regulator [Paraburkholderia sp. UYCP14C]